jgi:hypothetical protein
VTLINDSLAESNETFSLGLSAPSGATISDGTGVATILDDDSLPTLSIGDATITEGNKGTKNVTLTVTLSAPSTAAVTVTYATADGTATAPADYLATAGSLTFAPGQTSLSLTVPVVGDKVTEPTEVFYVDLSAPTNASIAKSQGTVTIPAND